MALDIGKDEVVACIRVPDPRGTGVPTGFPTWSDAPIDCLATAPPRVDTGQQTGSNLPL